MATDLRYCAELKRYKINKYIIIVSRKSSSSLKTWGSVQKERYVVSIARPALSC